MDGRSARRDASRKAILGAIERLKNGTATHARHAGLRVRITKEAVAREARLSPATLYRFPDLVEVVGNLKSPTQQSMRPSEAYRKKLLAQITELERQNIMLLSENLNLTRALVQYDPTLGRKIPTAIETGRERHSIKKKDLAG